MIEADRVQRTAFFSLTLVLVLAAGLRLYRVDAEAFWQDEIHSLYNSAGARGPLQNMPHGVILKGLPRHTDLTDASTALSVWRTMDHDSHPPLYFLLLLAWRRLVGEGEAAIRLMPVIFSVLSIVPVALVAKELGARRASAILALILALSFCHINMAQENRPYSLSGLFVNLSFYLLVRMEGRWATLSMREKFGHAALYGATLFLAMMNHYFAGFAFCGQLVYVLLRWRGSLLHAWLSAATAAALLFLVVWGPHLLGQREFIAAQDWLDEKLSDHAQRTVLRTVDLPIRFLFRVSRFQLSAPNALLGAGLMTVTCLYLWLRRARPAAVFACWYLVPVLAFAMIDIVTERQHLTHFRYPSVALPGLAGLLAVAISELTRRLRIGVIIVFLLAATPTVITLPAQDNPHSRAAAGLIAKDVTPDDLLVFDAIDWPSFWASRLFQMVSYYLPFNPPTLLLRDWPDEALRTQIASYDRVYVVSPRTDDIANHTPQTHPYIEASEHIFQIGWVYRCTRTPPRR